MKELNIQYFRMVNDLGKEYERLNPVFIITAEYTVYLLALTLLLFWFIGGEKNRIMVMSAGVSFILAEVFGKIASLFHSNYQPFVELADVNQLIEKSVNNSFPSDHTILFFSVCSSFWLLRRRLGTLFVLIAVLVGLSRIGVGVHYPADVLVGALVGIFSAVICYWTLPKIKVFKWILVTYEKGESHFIHRKSKDIS